MIQLSDKTKFKIKTDEQYKLSTHTRNFADVLLIALNKNQQYVKAIAASSKKICESQLPDEPADKRTRMEL